MAEDARPVPPPIIRQDPGTNNYFWTCRLCGAAMGVPEDADDALLEAESTALTHQRSHFGEVSDGDGPVQGCECDDCEDEREALQERAASDG